MWNMKNQLENAPLQPVSRYPLLYTLIGTGKVGDIGLMMLFVVLWFNVGMLK